MVLKLENIYNIYLLIDRMTQLKHFLDFFVFFFLEIMPETEKKVFFRQ